MTGPDVVVAPRSGMWGLVARGVAGGIVAGAAFLAVNMWFATSRGMPAKTPLLMMSTLVEGDAAMMDGSASVGVGLLVHAVLSVAFGLSFAVATRWLRDNALVAVAGPVFGVALYLVNFKVFASLWFTTFEGANQPFELLAHLAFGVLVSLAFLQPRMAEMPLLQRAIVGACIGLSRHRARRCGPDQTTDTNSMPGVSVAPGPASRQGPVPCARHS